MSPNTERLAGRAALVTGSTGGLGVAIASALAAAGAFVIVSGRDKARGDAVVADIRSAGGTAEFVVADLGAGEHEVRRLAEQATVAAGGRIDILVNNAAMLLMPTPTAEISEELLRDAFAVNVFAPFLLTGALAPAMVQRVRARSSTSDRSPGCVAARVPRSTAPTRRRSIRSPNRGPPNTGGSVCGSTPSRRDRSRRNARSSSPTTSLRRWPASRHGG
jgi:NAD(P)-dependent dehydrogenase (short-subunit alcohol dehydrogenase family)